MISSEIKSVIEIAISKNIKLIEEDAFDILALQYLCHKTDKLNEIWYEASKQITDGSNDGGIDYVFFDEEENKVIIGQNKYSKNISTEDFATEINKIIRTLTDFEKGNTGRYNQKVKSNLQNALDRLSDESLGNVEIYFSSISDFNEEDARRKIQDLENQVSAIHIFQARDIDEVIEKMKSNLDTVSFYELKLDIPLNYLKYDNNNQTGVVVNISSESLTKLYNAHHTEGLFNLNIRKYIRNKKVDEGIQETLNKYRDDFWFLNNGLTIACSDFDVDGDNIKIFDFSIVNGGQTTTLIGNYKGNNNQEFFIPCKVVKSNENLNETRKIDFYNKIAESTNSQKPIQPRDLKANSREMVSLKNIFAERDISFEIKRGEKVSKRTYRIKNDEYGQLVYSFVNQKPGTSRSNKRSLFDNNKRYNSIYYNSYKDVEKIDFLEDLIVLNDRFTNLSKKMKEDISSNMTKEQAEVFDNGKMTLFALFGIVYRIVNNDIEIRQLNNVEDIDLALDMSYGFHISNYKGDDIDSKLKDLILFLTDLIEEEYRIQYETNKVSSVSNFLKTDKKYTDEILGNLARKINRDNFKKELLQYGEILKRKS